MVIIGIVGGIGSGKSEVARLLEKHGAVRIDADAIGHRILERPAVLKQLVSRWGEKILDGDGRPVRYIIAEQAFRDPRELSFLNHIVHPPILKDIRSRIERARRDGACCVVVDAALLLESQLDEVTDIIVYVRASRATRVRRVRERSGFGPAELDRRERQQISLRRKAARADITIENNSTIEHLDNEVSRLWSQCITGQSHWRGPRNTRTAHTD